MAATAPHYFEHYRETASRGSGYVSRALERLRLRDPRLLQLLFLGSLLGAGAWWSDFDLRPAQVFLTFAAAIAAQSLLGHATGELPVSWRSALITALGLSLLLRADSLWVYPVAAAAAIGSKFALRAGRKHLFNPANLGVILALTLLPGTWVSPGQWGQDVALAGWLVALGAIVSQRARRADISWSFLLFYLGALALRVLLLGQRAAVWTHQFSNGALLLFAFFMISDPMTSPNDRRGRLAHAAVVATLAYAWQFHFYRTNGFLWALFVAAPLVPLWDFLWPAPKFEWKATGASDVNTSRTNTTLRLAAILVLGAIAGILPARPAAAFCGFYVGKADSGLYNHASQVVYVRHGDRNVLSIMNDYQGEPSDFALVVPVPEVLQKGQIHIGDRELFQRLDAYSAPRLVEYYDPDPCARVPMRMNSPMAGAAEQLASKTRVASNTLGVSIEAKYTVGEYDILILSATQSRGLETWLQQNGYKIPAGAGRALEPYIRQNMKFFVARVNLKAHQRTGLSYLRPLQFAFDSPKFMLPIRLGMINAQGPQDLVIYLLTEGGRVETVNYRTVKVPSGMDLPNYIRGSFGQFYSAMFDHQVAADNSQAVFTEYVWNMGWCDPCAAPPLSREELRQLGVFWLDDDAQRGMNGAASLPYMTAGGTPVTLTRLHVRYSAETFPEDLMFQETADQQPFQARYVLRREWSGSSAACAGAEDYFAELRKRHETEAATLADLTGWDLGEVYRKAGFNTETLPKPRAWWEDLWNQ